MRTKNNTNQQIIPTHNRDNEICDIADKREYEVNLDKKYFPIKFSFFRETWKNPMIRLEMLAKQAEIKWKDQKRKLHSSHPQQEKWGIKTQT